MQPSKLPEFTQGKALFLPGSKLAEHLRQIHSCRLASKIVCPDCKDVPIVKICIQERNKRLNLIQDVPCQQNLSTSSQHIVIVINGPTEEAQWWGFLYTQNLPTLPMTTITRTKCTPFCFTCREPWYPLPKPTPTPPIVATVTINEIKVPSSPPTDELKQPLDKSLEWETFLGCYTIPLHFHWDTLDLQLDANMPRAPYESLTNSDRSLLCSSLEKGAVQRLDWLREIDRLLATQADAKEWVKVDEGMVQREMSSDKKPMSPNPKTSSTGFQVTKSDDALMEQRRAFIKDPTAHLRTEWSRMHRDVRIRFSHALKTITYLTPDERTIVNRRSVCEGIQRRDFTSLWWLMSVRDLVDIESWLEMERRVIQGQIRHECFHLGSGQVSWCEETYHKKQLATILTQPENPTTLKVVWRTLTMDYGGDWVKVSGLGSMERWYRWRADKTGSIRQDKMDRDEMSRVIGDLFVRIYKSRVLSLRHLLVTDFVGVCPLLQTASHKLGSHETWKRYMTGFATPTLAVDFGLPPVCLPSFRGPKPFTTITHTPRYLSDLGEKIPPNIHSMRDFYRTYKIYGQSKEEKGYNATNMTDGGCALIPHNPETLLLRAFLSMTCTDKSNVWSQWKEGVKKIKSRINSDQMIPDPIPRPPRSRLSIELEPKLTEQWWMDPLVQYMPVLRGFRVWEPIPILRDTACVLSNEFRTLSIAMVVMVSARDICRDPLLCSPVIVESSGRIPNGDVALRDTSALSNLYPPDETSEQRYRRVHSHWKRENTYPKSSFIMIFPSIHLPLGGPQKTVIRFCQKRLTDIFGVRLGLCDKTMSSMIDDQPNDKGGGGSRFIYDDRCIENICESCNSTPDREYKPHANRCPFQKCERIPEERVKSPFAALDVVTGAPLAQVDWKDFVLSSSLWPEEDKDTELIVQTIEKTSNGKFFYWTRHKKLEDTVECKISLYDPRIVALEKFLQRTIWNHRARLESVKMMVMGVPQGSDRAGLGQRVTFYQATMAKNTVHCLNMYREKKGVKEWRVHNRKTIIRISRRDRQLVVDDYACIKSRQDKIRTDQSKGGVSAMIFTPHKKQKTGHVDERARDRLHLKTASDNEHLAPREWSLPAELFDILFP